MPDAPGFLAIGMRHWWEEKFYEMGHFGRRFDYADLLSGHVSMSAALFKSCGGFDGSYRCREDYELGIRLMLAGVSFRYLPKARARHHETPELRKSFTRSSMEGAADVRLTRRYPELVPALLLARLCHEVAQQTRRGRMLAAFRDEHARRLELLLRPLERISL